MTTSVANTKKVLTIDDFKVGQRVRYKYSIPNPYLDGEGVVAEVFRRSVKVKKYDGNEVYYSILKNFEILEQPKEPEDKAKLPDINKFKLSMSDEALAQEFRYGAARQIFLRGELKRRGYSISILSDDYQAPRPLAEGKIKITHIYLKKTITEEIEL